MVIARSDTGQGIVPRPSDTSAVRNDHLGYAVTWFGLAAVWAGMTIYWLWRIRRRSA
jgi:surfeit locus 1 family protein